MNFDYKKQIRNIELKHVIYVNIFHKKSANFGQKRKNQKTFECKSRGQFPLLANRMRMANTKIVAQYTDFDPSKPKK